MVVKHNSPHKHVWESHEYWFCSAGCRTKFVSNPKQYVALPGSTPMPAKLTSANAKTSSGKYTCPMHPEIVKDGPGSCPICGMALEPVMVESSAEPSAELRELTGKVKEIEDSVFDLKAVNPNRKSTGDTRTPAEILAVIDISGQEIVEALSTLRHLLTKE
jgi:YHS domain-containing protein